VQSSANVLIQGGIAKITDFGLSSMLKQTISTSRGEGSTAYIDPVTFENESYKRGIKSDIFSFGVILWEISSGKSPCEGRIQSFEIILYRLKGSRDPPFPETPKKYIELYSKCWDNDPNKRPLSEEVYKQLKSLHDNDCDEALILHKSLNLSHYNLRDTGTAAVAKALSSNSSLTSLDLIYNQIGDKGAAALAKALESNLSLMSLNLNNNKIGDTGAAALAKALESNSLYLISLDLSWNQIGGTGATALAKALESNSSLASLYLK